jgi:LysR family glycine cleavage system transcriptional activator
MSAFVTVMAAGRTSSLPYLLRDAFFPVCSSALLEGMHPLRGPEDLKHHTLIHDRSMASENAFPTWRTWLQAASFPEI